VVDGRSATRWDAQIEERRNRASHRADGSLPLEGPALQRVEAVVFAAEGSAQLKRGCEAEQHRKSNPARAATAQATQPVPMLAPSCMCAVAMDSPSAPRGNSMKSLKLVQNISQVDPRRAKSAGQALVGAWWPVCFSLVSARSGAATAIFQNECSKALSRSL
jgi:hypothetical protein